jgi:light-harvesting protein B-800-850 alpha chain
MIYGKLWCVVKPSTGIPLFLTAVALSSFLVHLCLVLNTTWVKSFLNGSGAPAAKAALVVPEAERTAMAPSATITVRQ